MNFLTKDRTGILKGLFSPLQVKTPGPEEDAANVLKPRSKLKRPQGTKILSSKQGQRLMKQHLETAVEGGGPASHSIADAGGDQAMEIDESSLPLKLRSKKKGVPEKFHAERVVFPTASSSGGPASHKEPVKREPACCTHATPELGPASAKVCLHSDPHNVLIGKWGGF